MGIACPGFMFTIWPITVPSMDKIQEVQNNVTTKWHTETQIVEQTDGGDHDNTPLAREAQGKISLYS